MCLGKKIVLLNWRILERILSNKQRTSFINYRDWRTPNRVPIDTRILRIYITKKLNSCMKLEANAHYLKILSTSYNESSSNIIFSLYESFSERQCDSYLLLMKPWIVEGFLRLISGKSVKVVAEEYLKDLVDRNLILVLPKFVTNGKVKLCITHDILRDLCLREAQKEIAN